MKPLMMIAAMLFSSLAFSAPKEEPLKQKETPSQTQTTQSSAEKNLQASNTFLEENKKKPGVTVLPNGLQYKVLSEGSGKSPTLNSFVSVKYKGTLPDGTIFDQTTNEPVTFAMNSIIPGWQEALQLMKEGSKWVIYVPASLAYGEKGVGRIIGPNQALVFEIELVNTDSDLEEAFKDKKQEVWEDQD